MSTKQDKYDIAIQDLYDMIEEGGEHELNLLGDIWGVSGDHNEPQLHEVKDVNDETTNILFRYAVPTNRGKCICGCLTQIKWEEYDGPTPELTAAIRADERIPRSEDLSLEDLPVFAEWHRKFDVELGPWENR